MNASAEPNATTALLDSAKRHLYPNYAQPDIIMDRGEGACLWDTQGRRYIDFFAGIAVAALGHGHPRLVQALADQSSRLIQLSNHFYTAPNIQLAEKLCGLTGMARAFFCNSGTEAIEAGLKLSRRHYFEQGQSERHVIVAFENSFHGRTMGALAATGQPKYRDGFGPLSSVRHAAFGDIEGTARLMGPDVAAILVEPIQGEGGVLPAKDGFLNGLRQLCDQHGALLIVDEIQTGVGRTGAFLGIEHAKVKPDVIAMAKGLGGGFPIGAMLCGEHLAGALPKGSHGTTYGGNPLGSAVALAVLSVIEEQAVVERVARRGAELARQLEDLVARHSIVAAQRGIGFLQGLVLADPSKGPEILSCLRERGLLVSFTAGTTLRLTPPLLINDAELQEGLDILDAVLGEFS